MKFRAHPLTAYTVRAAIAHYLGVPTPTVELRQTFARDLGMDAFDIALAALPLASALRIEIALHGLEDTHTVGAFAERVESALREDERRTAAALGQRGAA